MNIFKNRYFIFSIFLLSLYIGPFIYFGQDSYILIHDNLDANVVWFKTLVENGMMFSNNYEITPMFMEAPRVSFGSEWNIILWLNYFFEPYTAYVINQILIRLVAFAGMYLLLKRYVFKIDLKQYSILLALLYSLLPFWPSGGLSVAGLPLITYVLLNIRNNISIKADWIILVIIPFYSSFVLSMMFFIALASFVWMYDLFKKKMSMRFTITLSIFALIYLAVNYRLIDSFVFSSEYTSHRVERVSSSYGLMDAFIASLKHFIVGQYHAHSLHIVFMPFIILVFFINIASEKKDKLLVGLFLLNIFISLWYGFWKYEGWEYARANIQLINSLNLSRLHFLTPLIWYVLFALSIKYYLDCFEHKYKSYIVNTIIAASIVFLFFKSDFISEYRSNKITYKEFYSQDLFKKIDDFIGQIKSNYRVVSLGIHPSIARYNGFYTLDGYLANYSLEYKHQFRKVISQELEKNYGLKKSFDNWGSRCYLFSGIIGYSFLNTKEKVIGINVNYNTEELYKMGGKYIFSSYKIMNDEENHLKLSGTFEENSSVWKIYVYKILL